MSLSPSAPLPTTLAAWLDYQQSQHPRAIALGLERVRGVWSRLGAPSPAPCVITVGGTNGKGSTVALLEAMLAASGRRVGCYTSPHLLRYNERVRIDGCDAEDAALVAAFERIEAARIEAARGPVPLTYFEYGTLAALLLFADAALDVVVLEVGLGGRLDATNLVDADVSIVTTVDFDHQDWLGHDLDAIGREKAGIARPGRPLIVGDAVAPPGLLDAARNAGAIVCLAGRDYRCEDAADGWIWSCGDASLHLPPPRLAAACQRANAGAAIAALWALRDRLGWDPDAIAQGVAQARIAARLQRFGGASDVIDMELVVDVGHNPQAARVLAAWLAAHPAQGRTQAVFGALADKDVAGIVQSLLGGIDDWHLAGLAEAGARAQDAEALAARFAAAAPGRPATRHATVADALDAAAATVRDGDRVLAFGSFFVATAALEWARARGLHEI